MKTLTQNIDDLITIGSEDAAGLILRIIFTQETAAQAYTDITLTWGSIS